MNVSREQADKIIVGGGDVSFPDGGPDVSPTGTAVLNGPVYIGKPTASPEYEANLNVASNGVSQSTLDRQPKYQSNLAIKVDGNVSIDGDNKTIQALLVNGDVTINGNTNQDGDITATGTVKAATLIGAHTSGSISGGVGGKSAGAKAFDIPHPSKEEYRLRHICVEGPESAVYFRGVVKNEKIIKLPHYWKDLVHINSITIQLTPIGSHQDVIVKRWDDETIYLQSNGGMPIHCFYHVYAERKDIGNLIVEYAGKSPADYPGDNREYQIAGYNT